MRIIAGKYRRRKILANRGGATRPITDFVKETLFEHISQSIVDARVADVFAGTGTIGLEALSRGARSVVCFESDRNAFDLLKQNVEALGVGENVFCWRVDVLRTSFRPKGLEDFLPYDVVFCDPPFAMVGDLKPGSRFFRAMSRLAREDVTAGSARLFLRTPKRAHFELPEIWHPDFQLDIAGMAIHAFRKKEPASQPPPAETTLD